MKLIWMEFKAHLNKYKMKKASLFSMETMTTFNTLEAKHSMDILGFWQVQERLKC